MEPLEPRLLLSADLTIGNVSYPGGTYDPGDTFNVSGTAGNSGNTSAPACVLEMRLSADRTWSANDIVLGRETLPAIPAGQGGTAGGTAHIPEGTPPGSYYVLVMIDANGQVTESDEGNNLWKSAAANITVQLLRPDLALSDVTGVAGTHYANGPLTGQVYVANLGGADAAGTFWYEARLSKDKVWGNADDVSYYKVSESQGVSAGAAFWRTISGNIGADTPAGSYYAGVMIDSTDAITEADENNNIIWTPTASVEILPPQADLAVSNITGVAGTHEVGDPLSGQVFVQNLGGADVTASFQFEGRLSLDQTWGNADDVVFLHETYAQGVVRVSGISHSFSGTIPPGTAPGAYYVAVRIDSANEISEISKDNNITWSSTACVEAQAATQPDMVVSWPEGFAGTYGPGESIAGRVWVENAGDADVTKPFQYEARLSINQVWGDGDDLIWHQESCGSAFYAGEDHWHYATGQVPSGAPEGSCFVGLMIDSTNTVDDESDEGNNILWVPITVATPGRAPLTETGKATRTGVGWSVCIDGNRIITGGFSGDVCIFEDTGGGWQHVADLTASGGTPTGFGYSVSLSGNTAIVGAWGDEERGTYAGAAYVYREIGGIWTQVAKLTANDGDAGDQFGWSVSIRGTAAIVGAWLDDDRGTDSGSAYVFREVGWGWTQVAKLTSDDTDELDYFGGSVSIDGNTAIVGAAAGHSGERAAYVFQDAGSGWTQVARWGGDYGGWLGSSVAISGDTAIVGADRDGTELSQSGSAYIFRYTRGTWQEVAKLTASDAKAEDFFGCCVAIDGDVAIVGAQMRQAAYNNPGSAYVFRDTGSGWEEIAKLKPSDSAFGDRFGSYVSLSGGRAVTGAVSTGAIYVYDVPETQAVTIGDGHAGSLRFTDGDGTAVTVSISGGGTAEIHLGGDVQEIVEGRTATALGEDLSIWRIILSETTLRSALSFSCRGGTEIGTTVGEITADGDLGRIAGRDVDLTDSIWIAGWIKTLQLDDLSGGQKIQINASDGPVGPRDKVTLTFDQVVGTYLYTNGVPIASLTATEWLGGSTVAPWIGRLVTKGRRANPRLGVPAVAGDFGAYLKLGGAGAPGGVTLGSARIAGGVGGDWGVNGDAGSVSVAGEIDDWYARFGSLRALTVGNVRDATVIVDDVLGSVRATCWMDGRLEADTLKSLKVTGLRGNPRAGIAPVPGDFAAGLLIRGEHVSRGPALGSASMSGLLGSEGREVRVKGDAGTLAAGAIGGKVCVEGNARSVRVGQVMALVPALAGPERSLEVLGSTRVTAGRAVLQIAGGKVYANDQYRAEGDLRLSLPGAWWRYRVTYREGRETGSDASTTRVLDGGLGAYDLEYKSDSTYATDQLIHYVTGPAGEVCVKGFRSVYSAEEFFDIHFDPPGPGGQYPTIMPELVRAGDTYTAAGQFTGTFAAKYDDELYSGTCEGLATAVAKILGHEQVTVPWGTFLAVKAEITTTIRKAAVEVDDHGALRAGTATVTDKKTCWLVPALGEVKSVTSHTVSLSVPGAASWRFSETVTQELTDCHIP